MARIRAQVSRDNRAESRQHSRTLSPWPPPQAAQEAEPVRNLICINTRLTNIG